MISALPALLLLWCPWWRSQHIRNCKKVGRPEQGRIKPSKSWGGGMNLGEPSMTKEQLCNLKRGTVNKDLWKVGARAPCAPPGSYVYGPEGYLASH